MMTSEELYRRAVQLFPGGVNSPVRSFQHVGRSPLYIEKASGAYLTDVEGHSYIDFCLSFGPHLLGHGSDIINEAVLQQLKKGTSYGACHPGEIELAQQILRAYAYLDRVRLVNSGTEAVMTAIRLARGYSNRSKIIMFEGCYHGHSDSVLAKAGSGVAELTESASRGVPKASVQDTLVTRYDSLDSLKGIFAAHPNEIAALIFEPIPANYGLWIPSLNHIQKVVELAKQNGALVICDEVITGFRLGLAGASGFFDLRPDLVTLGKVIGGGFPLAAVVGKKEVMEKLAPAGDVYQAGTLSGNAASCAAGSAVLNWLFEHKSEYTRFEKQCESFYSRLGKIVSRGGAKVRSLSSLFWIHFGEVETHFPPSVNAEAKRRYAEFFKKALEEGLYFPPSPFEVAFLSFTHTPDVLEEALHKLDRCFQ